MILKHYLLGVSLMFASLPRIEAAESWSALAVQPTAEEQNTIAVFKQASRSIVHGREALSM